MKSEEIGKLIDDNLDKWIDEMPAEDWFPSLKFLIGQGMRETKGRANPIILRRLFIKKLLFNKVD